MDTEVASHLQSEIQKIWERLVALENRKPEHEELKATADDLRALLEKGPAKVVRVIASTSSQCSKYFNRIKGKHDTCEQMLSDWTQRSVSLQKNVEDSQTLSKTLETKLRDIEQKETRVANEYTLFSTEADSWHEKLGLLSEDYETCKNNCAEIEKISQEIQSRGKESDVALNRIMGLHKQIVETRDRAKEVLEEITGYDYEDETSGETRHEEGLKEKLQNAFKDLEKKHEAIRGALDDLKKRQEEAYDAFLSSRQAEAKELKERIESLLPNALTAGLSSAYAEKRKNEENEKFWVTIGFVAILIVMILVAFLPIAVMLKMHSSGLGVMDVFMRSPRVILAFLPLYTPLVWLAIVFNKRMNLAKRLIEEYSHKEALSKTFEGLATQIEALGTDKNALDLRVRLLHNLIAVSAENPGKLITGYNRADNPIFEFLDKSAALGKSLEKLASIPGFDRVLQTMNKRNERKREEAQELAQEGISSLEDGKNAAKS